MSVFWLGETNNYEQMIERRQLKDCNIILACNDYAVVEASDYRKPLDRTPKHCLCIPRYAAKACTSRLAQRVALSGYGLNPSWNPVVIRQDHSVVKACGSTQNLGIAIFRDLGYTARPSANEQAMAVHNYYWELRDFGVSEEQIKGKHYELDGCVIADQIMFFNIIEQEWDYSTNKILSYKQADLGNPFDPCGKHQSIYAAAEVAIRAIGLDSSCFCIEFIHVFIPTMRDTWFVIEVNARLGDDKGLAEVMCKTGNPIKEVEEFCKEVLGK